MNLLQNFNSYSLDVAAGAMISTICFAHVLKVELSSYTIFLLGLTVWVIYTFDHLDDARNLKMKAITTRHQLHQQHFKLLSGLLILGLVACAVMVFFTPRVTLLWGVSLLCSVAIYFVLLKFLKARFSYFKEIVISIIYSGGILLGPLSIFEGTLLSAHYLLFIQFLLVALSNLVLFSIFEEATDKKQRFPSIVGVIGTRKSKLLIHLIFLIEVVIIISQGSNLQPFSLLLGAMSGILSLLVIYGSFFKKSYRLLGDGVFMLPAIILLV